MEATGKGTDFVRCGIAKKIGNPQVFFFFCCFLFRKVTKFYRKSWTKEEKCGIITLKNSRRSDNFGYQ